MRRFLPLMLLGMAVCCSTLAARSPNVIFVLSDDLGYGDLHCYGNPWIDTPVLDRLAADGVRLTDHYAPSPLCAPSRAGFLTGRFNHRTGAIDVSSNRGIDRIELSEKTFGDYFGSAGYATALIGKWHNGLYCRDYLPHRRGFDLFYGFPNGGQDFWKWNLLRNDAHERHDGRYLTDALNDEAIRFVRSHKEEPFAIFLAHHAPHPPLQAPQPLIDKYRAKLDGQYDESVAVIYAMIESMDSGLGRLFEAVKEEGLWDDTIIVFTSDNGAHLGASPRKGEFQRRFHAGLAGNKGDVGEQGIRVPAIVSWPGHIEGGLIISTPIHGCDWLPTLFSFTKAQPPGRAKPLDGVNLARLLVEGNASEAPDRFLPFQKNRYTPVGHSDAAIRHGAWKLYWPGAEPTMRKDSARDNPSYLRGVVHPHWEMPLDPQLPDFADVETEPPRLFDLRSDPGEQHDLAIEYPDKVRRLTAQYDAWFAEVFKEWEQAHQAHIEYDRQWWHGRPAPDPRPLFEEFWQWNRLPSTSIDSPTDPLELFSGFWNASHRSMQTRGE